MSRPQALLFGSGGGCLATILWGILVCLVTGRTLPGGFAEALHQQGPIWIFPVFLPATALGALLGFGFHRQLFSVGKTIVIAVSISVLSHSLSVTVLFLTWWLTHHQASFTDQKLIPLLSPASTAAGLLASPIWIMIAFALRRLIRPPHAP